MVYAATKSWRDGKAGPREALGSLSARWSVHTSMSLSCCGDLQLATLGRALGCSAAEEQDPTGKSGWRFRLERLQVH